MANPKAPIQDSLDILYAELGECIERRAQVARGMQNDSGRPPCDWCHDIGRLAQAIKTLSELRVW